MGVRSKVCQTRQIIHGYRTVLSEIKKITQNDLIEPDSIQVKAI